MRSGGQPVKKPLYRNFRKIQIVGVARFSEEV